LAAVAERRTPSLAVTVNGFTYSETESNPFINYAYLPQVFQEVQSSGCSTVYGVCTYSYILAYSTQTPFVFKLDFNHPLHSTELDPGSNTYFLFNDGPDLTTGFYGSIEDVRVHPDGDEPAVEAPAGRSVFPEAAGVPTFDNHAFNVTPVTHRLGGLG
jgi:hypothetical protein